MEIDLIQYIEEKIPSLKGNIYPVFTTDLFRLTVAYTVTPVSGGHVKQSMAEFKIINEDLDLCKETEKELNCILDMEEDTAYVSAGGIRMHSALAGGGTLYNEEIQQYEVTVIYVIDWRQKDGKR